MVSDFEGLPMVGDGMCCLGAAAMDRCTCWRPEHDLVQAPVQEGPPAVRETMCTDCAFRPTSPERSGDERYAHSGEGEVEALGLDDGTFYCHQGMRRRLAMVHPAGVRVEIEEHAYDPPVRRGGCPHKADGSPADICAGFAARALRGGR